MSTAKRSRRIGILVLSTIADDPRVRRQGEIFWNAGWDVIGFGLPGGRSPLPAWPIITPEHCHVDQSSRNKVGAQTNLAELNTGKPSPGRDTLLRQMKLVHSVAKQVGRLGAVWFAPSHVRSEYWKLNTQFSLIYELAAHHRCDVWLANDWTTLPIAERLAADQGTPLLYDTHELASNEFPERWRWRLLWRPIIKAIEGSIIHRAALVSCVSSGIAEELRQTYRLTDLPLTIRNTPSYEATPFRPTGNVIHVLYHGIVAPGRGLEASIRSVRYWRPEFHLTIRGPAPLGYERDLREEIATCGLSSRITLAPPVATIDLVREAAGFDIGLFALPDHSLHNRLALPNKFFEYVMAGLALCVSDLPEMRRLMNEYRLGVSIGGAEATAIATAINSLDRPRIDAFKRNSLEAARELNWQNDGARLESAANSILERWQRDAHAALVSN